MSKMLRRLEAETERAGKDMKLKGKSKTTRSRNSTAATPIKQTRSSMKETRIISILFVDTSLIALSMER